ncbi:MAG: tetratricopeptide repeat protein [Alphaproteobacteria bacterium]|nr:tetratricopeptide repeat protein [Alphaproteobacteria bacterium]
MRTLLSKWVVALALFGAGAAWADQTDPDLDSLFDILETSGAPAEVHAAEQLIWRAWMRHENETFDSMMREGTRAMNAGRLERAAELFTDLVEQAPDYSEAWNKRATVYFLQGELDRSAADVDRTLELEPRHFGALSGLGQIELLRGNGEAAIEAFQGALDIHPYLPGLPELIESLEETVRGREL